MGIDHGLNDIVKKHLLRDINSSRYSSRLLSQIEIKENIDCNYIMEELLCQMRNNLNKASSQSYSKHNWRQEQQLNISAHNPSKEVKLERRLVNVARELNLSDPYWWNQMPVASGFFSPNSDRRSCMDLVCKIPSKDTFNFIELKVESNNPVYAIFEIMKYGLVYLALCDESCNNKFNNKISKNFDEFKNASQINLMVYAPEKYYIGWELGWLENGLNLALKNIRGLSKQMSIGCYSNECLPEWEDNIIDNEEAIHSMLIPANWNNVFSR